MQKSQLCGLRFAKILVHNRMAVLAKQVFARINPVILQDAQRLIREQTEKYERSAYKLGDALTTYLKAAETRNIPTIVLKGLWLCEKIYQVPSMRPGGDIDILVRHKDVDACLRLLAEQGIDEFWPNLLKDEYHAVYLPSLLERADLPRIIFADGMLMYYLDVTEVLKQYEDIDWDLMIKLARDWG